MPDILIIGAGITGLSTAHYLKKPCRIIERESRPGGLCGSFTVDGCTFDYSGHFLHLRQQETERLVRAHLKKNIAKIERNAWIYTCGVHVPYPFQANLHALPEKVRKECLSGFIAAQKAKSHRAGPDFLSWSKAVFGNGITHYFMRPYNEKLWTVPASRLYADWVAPFVPKPPADDIRRGAEKRPRKRYGYNASFYYPVRGGCQALIDPLARGADVSYGTAACRVDAARRYVETSRGERLYYDRLVSTQPLPELLKTMAGVPAQVLAAAGRLDWNSVYCLNIAVSGDEDRTGGKHWVYFPEKKYAFYRAGIYTNIAPALAPRGLRTLYAEISGRPGGKPPSRADIASVFAGLADAGMVGRTDRIELLQLVCLPYAYVIYDRHRAAAVETIQKFLVSRGIHSVGRYGAWEYSFMEKSMIDGRTTAAMLDGEQPGRGITA
jgi:protoporphyrinogen oxidase